MYEEEITSEEFEVEIWEGDNYRTESFSIYSDEGWDTSDGHEVLDAFVGQFAIDDGATLRVKAGGKTTVARFEDHGDGYGITSQTE